MHRRAAAVISNGRFSLSDSFSDDMVEGKSLHTKFVSVNLTSTCQLDVFLFSFLFFSLSFEIIKAQHMEILRATLSLYQQPRE